MRLLILLELSALILIVAGWNTGMISCSTLVIFPFSRELICLFMQKYECFHEMLCVANLRHCSPFIISCLYLIENN